MKSRQRAILLACLGLLLIGLLLISGWIDAPFIRLISHLFKKPAQERWINNLHRIGYGLSLASLLIAGAIRFVIPALPHWIGRFTPWAHQGSDHLQAWLATFINPFPPDSPQPAPKSKAISAVDVGIGAGFLVFSLLFFLSRLQGNYPTVLLGGDGGNIASFATTWDHPELFKGDELLNSLDNIRIYATLHIPLIRALHPLTGDYGLAYLLLLAPHVFLHLLGFYILGRVLFKNRFWALLLAVVVLMPISINLGELWGISRDPLPRFTYQTILPYVLTLAIVWKDQPRRWPWLMVMNGLLFYAHPVSAPIFGFAIWLGLWLTHPRNWSLKKRAAIMLGLGMLFLAAASPFALNYFSYHVQGTSGNYDEVISIIKNFFPKNLLDVPAAMGDYWKIISGNGLFQFSLVGLITLWLLRRHNHKVLWLILTWSTGLFIITVIVPAAERTVEHYLKLLPLETELLRGIRYFVPIMLIFCLWPLSELSQRLKNRRASLALACTGLIFTAVWVLAYPPDFDKIGQVFTCLGQGRLVCQTDDLVSREIEAIKANVPQNTPIFAYTTGGPSLSYSLEVRYAAERPLVYTFKDRGLLGYANHTALLGWDKINHDLQAIEEAYNQEDRVESLIWFARGLHAQYLMLDFKVEPPALTRFPVTLIYSDAQSTLLYLKPEQPAP